MYTVDSITFYDFGVSAGDAQLRRVLDGSSPPILLSVPFRFFGTPESTLYVSQLCVLFHPGMNQISLNRGRP